MLELFGFTRVAFDHGEYWRLLSSQFVHLNQFHLLVNLFALVISVWLWSFFVGARTQAVSFLGGLMGVAIVLALDRSCEYYAGLSGALHGLWAGNALALAWGPSAHRRLRVLAAGVLLALLGKLLLQETGGTFTAALLDVPVYRPAHWAGLAGGLAMMGVVLFFRRPAQRQPQAGAKAE